MTSPARRECTSRADAESIPSSRARELDTNGRERGDPLSALQRVRHRAARLARGAAIAALIASYGEWAHAADVKSCVAASERGQVARQQMKLLEARQAFIECSAQSCPRLVKSSCVEWVHEIEASLPSVVIAVENEIGKDLTTAKVELDGESIAQGKALNLDPGEHVITVHAKGYQDATVPIVAREGEHRRVISVRLEKSPSSRGADSTNLLSPKVTTPSNESGSIRPITWITGGLALATLGSFAIFGLTGRAKAEQLRDTCAPTCSVAARDDVKMRYIVADVSLVAAAVFGAIAIVSALTTTPSSKTARTR